MAAQKVAGGALVFLLGISALAVVCIFAGTVMADDLTIEKLIEAKDSQIELLRWGAGIVITALSAAVGTLWAALRAMGRKLDRKEVEIREKDKVLLDEVRKASEIREEFLEELRANREARERFMERIRGMEKKIDDCGHRGLVAH